MLDAHQLNIFLIAAETLNFTQAAQRLHMSQPSVSQHIHSLEKHFGTKLFIRQGRSITLSDAGRTLVPLARKFVKQSTAIDETMSSLHGRIQGQIVMGCNADIGKYILPSYLKRFHDAYPDITLSCQTKRCPTPNESLRDGSIHFLLTDYAGDLDPHIQIKTMAEEEILLITPPDHPWGDKEYIEIEDLYQGKFILHEEESDLYQTINTALSAKGVKLSQLDSFLHLRHTETIILSVEKGLGLGFAPQSIATLMGNVHTLPIRDAEIRQAIYIARDGNQPTTASRQAFWEFMP
jgi:DNA-binding transcriptional LysR family regulator